MRKRSWPDRKNRRCPDCGRIIYYTRADSFDRAVGNNSVCKSCAQIDRKLTMETIEKMRKPKTEEHRRKISEAHYKLSYKRYSRDINKMIGVELLSFNEFKKKRKEGFEWQSLKVNR